MIPLAVPAALARYSGLLKAAGVLVAVLAVLLWWNSHNEAQRRIGYERAQAERDAARAAAGAADRRLRDTLDDFDRRLDGATREAAIAAARTLRGVFDACVAEYRGVADAADGHLADAVTCRAGWPE